MEEGKTRSIRDRRDRQWAFESAWRRERDLESRLGGEEPPEAAVCEGLESAVGEQWASDDGDHGAGGS